MEEYFKEVWDNYPKKLGKKQALKHFKATVRTPAQLEEIKIALRNYIQYLGDESVSYQYTQHGSTWFNNWEDWIEYSSPNNINIPEELRDL